MTYDDARRVMVDRQIRPSDVTKYDIIEAFLLTPREEFLPQNCRDVAYAETSLEVGEGRFLLEPRVFAKLLDALNIKNSELVLDIGAAWGYSTAVIAHLAQAVIGVENSSDMVEFAQDGMAQLGLENAFLEVGPLALGHGAQAPYDVVILQGGFEQLNEGLIAQIKEGGRIAGIKIRNGDARAVVGMKKNGQIHWRDEFDAAANILTGFEAVKHFHFA